MTITALAAVTALTLAACGSSSSSTTTSAATSGGGGAASGSSAAGGGSGDSGTITYAQEQEWYDYNSGSSSGNATAKPDRAQSGAARVLLRGQQGHHPVRHRLRDHREDLRRPLTVKYTFNDKAVWSDGQPIGCADFLYAWAANSGRYNKDGTTNEPGNVPAEPAYLFDTASTSGLDQTQKPTCADGDKSVTLTYTNRSSTGRSRSAPRPDPASCRRTWPRPRPAPIPPAVVKAVETDDVATLTKLADFWNSGWTLDKSKGLPAATTIPSSGPYYVAAWDPGQSVTLKKNDKWWGEPAKTDTIVIRYISQDQQVSALASGEVDVIEPQPNPDVNAALTNLGNARDADYGSQFIYEHMDLSVKNGFANEKLREALFKCAPRQQIVDNLIVPSNPDAKLLNSLMLMDFQPGYEQTAAQSGFANYADVDLEGAKAAYAASGEAQGKTIRVIHIDPNPRRTNEVALLKASCDPAGFNIQDVPLSSDKFGPTLSQVTTTSRCSPGPAPACSARSRRSTCPPVARTTPAGTTRRSTPR